MKCPFCGAYNEDDSLFCANCGRSLTGPEAKKAAEKAAGRTSDAEGGSASAAGGAGGRGAGSSQGGAGTPFRGNGANAQTGKNNTWNSQGSNQNNSWNAQNTNTWKSGSRQGGPAGSGSTSGSGGAARNNAGTGSTAGGGPGASGTSGPTVASPPQNPFVTGGRGSAGGKSGSNRAPVLVAAVVALVVVLAVAALASGGGSSSGTTGGDSGSDQAGSTATGVFSSMVSVPDVTDYSLSTATSLLQDAGLSVGTVTHQNSDSASEGSVISQNPESGDKVSKSSAVDLVVSDGPQNKVHSYTLVQQAMTWEQAKAYCEAQGGYLATITSADEYSQVLATVSGTDIRVCWIGGYSDGGSWKWVTGEDFSYNDWASGEPNNDGGNENYLAMLCANDNWGWYDVPNDVSDVYHSYRIGFVMETES